MNALREDSDSSADRRFVLFVPLRCFAAHRQVSRRYVCLAAIGALRGGLHRYTNVAFILRTGCPQMLTSFVVILYPTTRRVIKNDAGSISRVCSWFGVPHGHWSRGGYKANKIMVSCTRTATQFRVELDCMTRTRSAANEWNDPFLFCLLKSRMYAHLKFVEPSAYTVAATAWLWSWGASQDDGEEPEGRASINILYVEYHTLLFLV